MRLAHGLRYHAAKTLCISSDDAETGSVGAVRMRACAGLACAGLACGGRRGQS
jgi:hypothetical protein